MKNKRYGKKKNGKKRTWKKVRENKPGVSRTGNRKESTGKKGGKPNFRSKDPTRGKPQLPVKRAGNPVAHPWGHVTFGHVTSW